MKNWHAQGAKENSGGNFERNIIFPRELAADTITGLALSASTLSDVLAVLFRDWSKGSDSVPAVPRVTSIARERQRGGGKTRGGGGGKTSRGEPPRKTVSDPPPPSPRYAPPPPCHFSYKVPYKVPEVPSGDPLGNSFRRSPKMVSDPLFLPPPPPSIGSLSSENADCSEPRSAPQSSAEPLKRPPQRPLRTLLRGKSSQRASRRVVPLECRPSGTLISV